MKFSYLGFVLREEAIIEISGMHESVSIETARQELMTCGIQITDIRDATMADLQIERLKRLRERILRNKRANNG